MNGRIFNVLFLCTGNSARSILAESILRQEGAGKFQAFSAGSHPKGDVHPLALKVLADAEYPADGFRSKGWEEFAVPGAPEMDFVFTVCDDAAGETCPVWPGQPITAHWGIADPAAMTGTAIERERAFVTAMRHMKHRVTLFTALPITGLERASLTARVRDIGHTAGTSWPKPEVA
jgi:arsenate reductase